MNVQQKWAWLILLGSVSAIIAYVVLRPTLGLDAIAAAMGTFGLSGIGPLIFRQRERPDERDKIISLRALTSGIAVGFTVLFLGVFCLAFSAGMRHNKYVETDNLFLVIAAALFTMALVNAALVLVLYRRKLEAGHA